MGEQPIGQDKEWLGGIPELLFSFFTPYLVPSKAGIPAAADRLTTRDWHLQTTGTGVLATSGCCMYLILL